MIFVSGRDFVGGNGWLAHGLMTASPTSRAEGPHHAWARTTGVVSRRWISFQVNQPDRGGTAGVFVGTDDHEEGVGEHGQGSPARPQGGAADLMLAWKSVSVRYREPLTPFPEILENVTQLELYQTWSPA
ncbi:hypothetical protein [Streptomyces halstedii]|uniref:hypothetical protein n=1 Tax=Streptomyces halstedii TaxID=1944 RepID=UPI0038175E72